MGRCEKYDCGRKSAGTGGHHPSKNKLHRDWVLRVVADERDITLAALALRMADELGGKADTGMLSRFFAVRASAKKPVARSQSFFARTS